jgi:DNA polymerase III subunit delta'
MPWSEIFGHDKPLAVLKRALQSDRLAHAYLFLGPEGVGKKTVALAFTRAVHCREVAGDFCGRCTECLRIANGNHPDVRVLEPAAGKKEINIGQIRDLERELSFRPFSGKRKVAVVDPAPLMNAAAQNAMLKTLEEPPGRSLIILIAGGTGGLLPTLVSRCLRLIFNPLSPEAVSDFLVSYKGMDRDRAMILAGLAAGNPGRALSPELQVLVERRRVWLEKFGSLEQPDYRKAFADSEELAAEKEESLRFLDWIEGWYRDLMVYSVRASAERLLNRDLENEIEQQAARYGLKRILGLRSRAVRTAARLRRNVNRRLALESLLIEALRTG